ncbi:hypothetical protein LUZ63_017590 [Rhynchospora breviuscula]|uniref:DNA/RNA-binding protein Alba-like domain-containing protein n=1 Tax=Rhynchospora breviuscula TaxID=2022672 RepID=A0A9Q0C2R8_9POAL|nr:hypothetical protein LUZ63_017590 [Rhynchospora breviuscula]
MDRYQRVEKPREDTPISENEIRITALGRMRNYISYALTLLQEKDANEIVIKAMGRAINKTVMIVELIKRRIVGLHQVTTVESIDITDVWEPLEEGLLPLETTRHVSMITITLSKNELDKSAPGYQPPLPADQVKPLADFDNEDDAVPTGRGRGRRGGGRGRSRGMSNGMGYDGGEGGWEGSRGGGGYGYGRRGRGRGRGGRGYYRGGRGGYYNDNYGGPDMGNDYGAYDDGESYGPPQPPQGRGRGRGRGMGRGRGRGRSRGRGRADA